MICALIRVRQNKWLYVSVKIERMLNLCRILIYTGLYMICQLKRAGINKIDLVRTYISVIRPVVEYACPVWHTILR